VRQRRSFLGQSVRGPALDALDAGESSARANTLAESNAIAGSGARSGSGSVADADADADANTDTTTSSASATICGADDSE
jgi:hypothetical protein